MIDSDNTTMTDSDDEVSAVMELNDVTGAFEYTLYSLSAPPYVRLYVPGTITDCHRPRIPNIGVVKPEILIG